MYYTELKGADEADPRCTEPVTPVKDVFPSMEPTMRVDGVRGELVGVRMSGPVIRATVSVLGVVEERARVHVEMELPGGSVVRGPARPSRVAGPPGGAPAPIALDLIGNWLDPDELRACHDRVAALTRASVGFLDSTNDVDADYRGFCADVVRCIRGYKALVAECARVGGQAALSEIVREGVAEFRKLWRIGNELSSVIESRDARSVKAAKGYTEAVVTPELMDGPIMRRSYEKPRGYPGDYGIMDKIYRWEPEGESAGAMFSHHIGLAIGEPVDARMRVAEEEIRAVARRAGSEAARIASVGCGSAEEIERALRGADPTIALSLIDQDPDALAYARRRLTPFLATSAHAGAEFFHASFMEMIRGERLLQRLPKQDLIYAMGIMDYLSARRARQLVTVMHGCLRPGGRILVANATRVSEELRWPLEYILDWSMVYRSAEEIRMTAADLENASVSVDDERTGKYLILRIDKPADPVGPW